LPAITVPDLLAQLLKVVRIPGTPDFDFSRHDPGRVASRILRFCLAASRRDVSCQVNA
jgi:hypothetical protein